MAQIREFTSTNASYFILDGVKYPKSYEAVDDSTLNTDRLKVIPIGRTGEQLLYSTHYKNVRVNGNSFTSLEQAISAINEVVFSKGGGSGGGGTFDGISIENTDSVSFTGDGTPSNPLKGETLDKNKSTVFEVNEENIKYPTIKAIRDYFFNKQEEVEDIEVTLETGSKSLDNSGNVTTPPTQNWRTTVPIPVTAGDVYKFIGDSDVAGSIAISVYGYGTSPQVLIGKINASQGVNFTIPIGVTSIRGCSYLSTNIEFKKVISEGEVTEGGKIKKALLPSTTTGILITPLSWGVIGHSIWASDGALNGIQTLINLKIQFGSYSKYAYSGNSLSSTSITSSTCILNTSKTNTWQARDIYTYDSITNDFKLNRPIGTQDDFLNNTGVETYYGALRVLHEKLKSLNPIYILIAGNALKRNNASYTSWSVNTAGHTLTDYSNALEWVANRLSWKFVNQFRDSTLSDDNLGNFTSDGLHPNNAGYLRIYHIWYNEFRKILMSNNV